MHQRLKETTTTNIASLRDPPRPAIPRTELALVQSDLPPVGQAFPLRNDLSACYRRLPPTVTSVPLPRGRLTAFQTRGKLAGRAAKPSEITISKGGDMNTHPFDQDFVVTAEQKERYKRDGFIKLDGFFNETVIAAMLNRVDREMGRGGRVSDAFKAFSMFNRTVYDFENDKTVVFELIERPYFRRALTELLEQDMFLADENCFELEKNVSQGFPWHVGVQSFGYQLLEDEGITIWTPLHPIDAAGQRGGMAYVPEHIYSGEYIYTQMEPAIVSTLRNKEEAGIRTNLMEYLELRRLALNTPNMFEIFEQHQVEDSFQPGDALLFNKMVIHRSIMLGEGELPRRAAYAMRLINAHSRYDTKRVQDLEFPTQQWGGEGPYDYKPMTRQHIEIGEAGATEGSLLSESPYFDDPERRTIRTLDSSG